MKKYLITSPEFYSDNVKIFATRFRQYSRANKIDFALLRDKDTSNYEALAEIFIATCKECGIKSFLHQDCKLTKKLKADGVHLTSQQFDKIKEAKSLGLEVIISTHLHTEVCSAKKLGADYVTYSPIFKTPNKGEPKGVEDLQKVLKECEIKVFALGGIVDAVHVKMIEESGAYGFASIRYFVE